MAHGIKAADRSSSTCRGGLLLTISEPTCDIETDGDDLRVKLAGRWTAASATAVEARAREIVDQAQGGRVLLDLSQVSRLDTLGAWVLDRMRHELGAKGLAADFTGARDEQTLLLNEVGYRDFDVPKANRKSGLIAFVEGVGRTTVSVWQDVVAGTSFFGEVVLALGRIILRPQTFRVPAVVNQLEQIAYRGLPIIALISFLVGAIVAQQGIFQLQRFGATPFVVDLVGILILRELAVLLTSIMIAGRSGSAFTAEIGSMKMREEIDALRVMGLDPVEVLIVPRVLALLIGLPLLTFLSMISALIGGGLVSVIYGGMSIDVFLSRLQQAIAFNTFMVGLIKAPFMALIIGLIASMEGMAVQGSAESLGRQVTSSVVKAIFMVIVVDAFFAIFFASIGY